MDCDMPFPSSKNAHFQNEAKWKTFLTMEMNYICVRIKKKHFHINGFALSLALKRRLEATQKWTIAKHKNYQ